MRVLLVAEAFGGGVFELVKMVAEGVSRAGHETAIAFGRRPETPADPREQILADVELIEMPWTSRSPAAQFSGARRLRRVLSERRPDVVHAYSAFAGVTCAALVPRSTPLVFTPQAYAFTMRDQSGATKRTYRAAERFASRRATVVGACSHDEARLARELGARRVVTVANGIPELDSDLPDRSRLEAARVIALGRTVPQRQPIAVARILAAIDDVASVAWVGGAGGTRGETGAAALKDAGITLTGWSSRDSVLESLVEATAYLHWTAWDGLPLSVLEAMATDTVVVASDIGPNREILGERQVCRSERGAIDLLRQVVSDRGLAAELLAEQRRRRVDYGERQMVEGWLEVYGELAGARTTPA